ncbi:MAG: 5-formyltetrahydrofolate cyclo-ligase [Rudaea sp.]
MRRRLRALRTQLAARARASAAAALVRSLEQLPEFLVDGHIAGYWAVCGEMPLHAVYASLRARGQGYFLPALGNARRLRFAQWQAGAALRNNRYGIPEPDVPATVQVQPDTLDLVLVPLLGFDRRGSRLGSGGGWYDRSFAFLRDITRPARPVLVGIGYHFQEIAELVPEPWDVRLDYVATDRELIDCTKSPA